jgi:4-amino-4-deoxy-L-arabinose transferase-like glycosyltransferase
MKVRHKKTKLNSYLTLVAIILLVILAVSVSLMSLVPPVSRDALTHHLAVPKLWVRDGGIAEYPDIPFSYYPMNLDILYAVSLYLGSDIAPKFIHYSFALLTAAFIFFYLKKRLNNLYGLLGALFFISLPVIVKLSISVYVDLGLIFFSTVSILYFLKWIEYNFRIKYIVLSSIYCGLALGTKYNGLVLLFILSFFVPLYYLKKSKTKSSIKIPFSVQCKAIGYGLLFAFISCAVFSPWMIKNYIQTGNPVYPLYKNIFNPENKIRIYQSHHGISNDSDGKFLNENDDKAELNHFLIRKFVFKEQWWETLLIPVRIFFQGKDDLPQYFDGKLNPFLLLLPIAAFCFNRARQQSLLKREQSVLAVFSLLFLLIVFFQGDMRIRYILPIIPPLVILSMYGLQSIYLIISEGVIKSKKAGSISIFVIIIVMISINAWYIVNLFHRVDPFPYIQGTITRDAYIQKKRPEYSVFQYANQYLSADSSILGLFIGNRRYYCDRNIIFDFKLFEKYVIGSESADEIVCRIKNEGITHLLINRDIFGNWIKFHFDSDQKKLILEFFKNETKVVFANSLYVLYKL